MAETLKAKQKMAEMHKEKEHLKQINKVLEFRDKIQQKQSKISENKQK